MDTRVRKIDMLVRAIDVSLRQIERDTKVPESILSKLRLGKSKYQNLTFRNVVKLERYYDYLTSSLNDYEEVDSVEMQKMEFVLFESSVSTYALNVQTGLCLTTISRLRNHRSDPWNLPYASVLQLVAFYDQQFIASQPLLLVELI